MRKLIVLAAFLCVQASPSAAYYCSSPSAPYCATSYGDFNDQHEFDRCKREMEDYQSDLENFLDCLSNESKQAIDEYNVTIESFNNRADG